MISKGKLSQPQKIIPFESKYRKKRFSHVTQGIINPLHLYKDPRKPQKPFEITLESTKVTLKPPIEKMLKNKAFVSEDLKTPFIYIKQLVPKDKYLKVKSYWNKSGNISSLREDKSIKKQQITDAMASVIPKINEDIANFLKKFLKNLDRLISMKLYPSELQNMNLWDIFRSFCKLRRLKGENKHELLVSQKVFVDFLKFLGWEQAKLPLEDLNNFFQLSKLDDPNCFFLDESARKQKKNEEYRTRSLDSEKNRDDSYLENDTAKKTTTTVNKPEPLLSIKALVYNYEKFLQERVRIKSLTSLQSSISRAELLRNLISDYFKNSPNLKASIKSILYSKIAFCLIKSPKDLDYIIMYEKLRLKLGDLAFETKTLMNFLQKKNFPDEMTYDLLLPYLESLQINEQDELKLMGDFVSKFKKYKQNFKEQTFTLLELVDFIYEKKYTRKDFETLTKLIKKVKKMFNISMKLPQNEEIQPKQHIHLSILGQSLNGMCHKAFLTSEILSHFLENLNGRILKNFEHYQPKNPEIQIALLHNLALDFGIKYLGNIKNSLNRLSQNLNKIHEEIEENPYLLQLLEDQIYEKEYEYKKAPYSPLKSHETKHMESPTELFQKAKENTRYQKISEILERNFLELNEEFTLKIHSPKYCTQVNRYEEPKKQLPGLNIRLNMVSPHFEDDQIIDMLNTKPNNRFIKNETDNGMRGHSDSDTMNHSDKFIKMSFENQKPQKNILNVQKKQEKSVFKIIKKNFIELPELLTPFCFSNSLELFKIKPYNDNFYFSNLESLHNNSNLEKSHKKEINIPFKLEASYYKEKTEPINNNNLTGQIDFKSTSKSFFIAGEKEKKDREQEFSKIPNTNLSKNVKFFENKEKKDDKMMAINNWMAPTLSKLENEKNQNKSSVLEKSGDDNPLNMSQILMQAKLNRDLDKIPQKTDKLGQSHLEETLNQSYYKPEAVEIGKYSVKSDLFREYELYLPVDYYTKFTHNKEIEQDSKWYIRPHHIETVTGFKKNQYIIEILHIF